MDSRIVSVEDVSNSWSELNELLTELSPHSRVEEFEEVDLRESENETSSPAQEAEEPTDPVFSEPVEETDDSHLIPESEKTCLVDESTSRFNSAEWFEKAQRKDITLAGLGGIGSWTALLLARLKPLSLKLYDFDVVNTVNMAGQLYNVCDVGISKVSAVSYMIQKFSNYYAVTSYDEAITPSSAITPITICGFDNMDARKTLFTLWKTRYKGNKEAIFIDGRLSAEEFQVFCITGADLFLIQKYERDWLFDDAQAEETICSYKQTSFCANMIASVMTNLFVNFITNLCDPVIPRALPFMTSYDANTMMLRTVMQ